MELAAVMAGAVDLKTIYPSESHNVFLRTCSFLLQSVKSFLNMSMSRNDRHQQRGILTSPSARGKNFWELVAATLFCNIVVKNTVF